MRPLHVIAFIALSIPFSCAQRAGAPADAGPTAVVADASRFTSHGLSIERPENWMFVAPDASVAPDTLVILQGPIGTRVLAPVIEVSRRPLEAADRRRSVEHLLTATTLELVQTFGGFADVSVPQNITLAGQPAAVIEMKLTEQLPDGIEVERSARFYGLMHNGAMWIIRCLGPADGSLAADFDAIVKMIELET